MEVPLARRNRERDRPLDSPHVAPYAGRVLACCPLPDHAHPGAEARAATHPVLTPARKEPLTMKYNAELAYCVSAYATTEFEADGEEAAILRAVFPCPVRLAGRGTFHGSPL